MLGQNKKYRVLVRAFNREKLLELLRYPEFDTDWIGPRFLDNGVVDVEMYVPQNAIRRLRDTEYRFRLL